MALTLQFHNPDYRVESFFPENYRKLSSGFIADRAPVVLIHDKNNKPQG
ncbi:MAG: hypothetical protein O2890_05995 [Cyanobacteria bacterium]|nr:hypothetical protein [Cyanobacteriota bacterium]